MKNPNRLQRCCQVPQGACGLKESGWKKEANKRRRIRLEKPQWLRHCL